MKYKKHVTSSGAVVYLHSSEQVSQLEEETMSQSVLTVTEPTPTSLLLDGQRSLYDNTEQGFAKGRHSLGITTTEAVLSPYSASPPVPMIAGANVTLDGASSMWTKSIAGNTWNAWFQSTNVVAKLGEDCLVTWPVEDDFDNDGDTGAEGTIREMGGLDDNPSANASYSSGDFMLYQVNATTVYVYEKGANKGSYSQPMVVGDLLGILVQNNEVSYVHIRNGVMTVIAKSLTELSSDMYFKGAINRGVGSSGHGSMGAVEVHTNMENTTVSAYIHGSGNEAIHEDDVERLATVGLTVNTGSVYSLLSVDKGSTYRYPTGAYRFVHDYSVPDSQSIVETS